MPHDDVLGMAPMVCAIAREAGASIMEIYADPDHARGAPTVETKADDSPLTKADLAAHQVISNRLRALTPAVPVVSEEDGPSQVHRQAKGTFWLVDPLDGTKEFIARNGEFTVNIALVHEGVPIWGVVYVPVTEILYCGGASFGSMRSSGEEVVPLRVAPAAGRYRVVASKSHLNEATRQFIDRLGDVDLVQAGSSLKFCRVAEGKADVYPRLAPTCEWDTAAAQAILEGAGGEVVDLTGARMRYGKEDVLNPGFVATAIPLPYSVLAG